MVAGIVLFVLSVVALGESSEPQCSRFHYEEKTLEKMIKTEIYVDKIKADTDDMHRELTEEFKGLREDMDNTKREVSDVKDQNIKFVNEIKERLDGKAYFTIIILCIVFFLIFIGLILLHHHHFHHHHHHFHHQHHNYYYYFIIIIIIIIYFILLLFYKTYCNWVLIFLLTEDNIFH